MEQNGAARWKWALLAVLCICMVPLVILAAYCYPCADDFRFGLYPHLAFEQTGSVWAALAGADVYKRQEQQVPHSLKQNVHMVTDALLAEAAEAVKILPHL